MKTNVMVYVAGPTGSGKTRVSVEIIKALKAAGFDVGEVKETQQADVFSVQKNMGGEFVGMAGEGDDAMAVYRNVPL